MDKGLFIKGLVEWAGYRWDVLGLLFILIVFLWLIWLGLLGLWGVIKTFVSFFK